MVIIPVYNCEKYINKCVDSILGQKTNYSIFVVIVEDGSTDKTKGCLKRYEGLENVKIIYQKNAGFSGARNSALKHIYGRYLMFVDADDYLANDKIIQTMLDIAYEKHLDVVECGYFCFRSKNDDERIIKTHTYDSNISVKALGTMIGQPWAKIFKSELFFNIQFPEGYWFEDSIISLLIYPRCPKAYVCSEIGYAYRLNPNGITSTCQNYPKAIDTIWIMELIYSEMNKLSVFANQELYEQFLRQSIVSGYRLFKQTMEVQEAAFMVLSKQKAKYFRNFSCDKNSTYKNIEVEKAFNNADFIKYRAVSRWLS